MLEMPQRSVDRRSSNPCRDGRFHDVPSLLCFPSSPQKYANRGGRWGMRMAARCRECRGKNSEWSYKRVRVADGRLLDFCSLLCADRACGPLSPAAVQLPPTAPTKPERTEQAMKGRRPCPCCGRTMQRRPRSAKLCFPHRCPHGKQCPGGDPLVGSHANGPRFGWCEGCTEAARLSAQTKPTTTPTGAGGRT